MSKATKASGPRHGTPNKTAASTTSAAAPKAPARQRGRPRVFSTGPVRAVNLTLDEKSLSVAARIHPTISVAVRLALEAWANAHEDGGA